MIIPHLWMIIMECLSIMDYSPIPYSTKHQYEMVKWSISLCLSQRMQGMQKAKVAAWVARTNQMVPTSQF